MFHGIGRPHAGVADSELPFWIEWRSFDSIVERAKRQTSGRDLVFTFDDGNASDLSAADKLAAAGLPGKFFVLTGRIGRPHYLSTGELRRMSDMGMEVGLHGRDHIDWRGASDEVLDREIGGARAALADRLGKPIHSVAIPFGLYNRRVLKRLDAEAFDRVYTSDPGLSRSGAHYCRRNTVMAKHGLIDIERIIDDRVSLLRRLRRTVTPAIKRRR